MANLQNLTKQFIKPLVNSKNAGKANYKKFANSLLKKLRKRG